MSSRTFIGSAARFGSADRVRVSEASGRLVERAREGDREAFGSLITPLITPGYQLAFAILRDRQEAEDAVQEASLKAWRKIGQLRAGTSLRAWFLSIVTNQARMSRRGRWTSVVKLADVEAASVQPSEDRLVESADLKRALETLNDDERLILFLHFALDLPLEEVGLVVGLSPAGAKSRLYRAIGRLRPSMREDLQ